VYTIETSTNLLSNDWKIGQMANIRERLFRAASESGINAALS
jgi:hypothetical protein